MQAKCGEVLLCDVSHPEILDDKGICAALCCNGNRIDQFRKLAVLHKSIYSGKDPASRGGGMGERYDLAEIICTEVGGLRTCRKPAQTHVDCISAVLEGGVCRFKITSRSQ
ncbi:MAG: hypothetical protein WCL44_16115 [bacterium]